VIARTRLRSEQGFTLIEVMAAITVFTIMTLGIVPLLLTSIRGGALGRSFTVGKNVALQATERARGLPYFVDYATQKGYTSNVAPFRKVDVLDMYFPADVAGDVFTTTCTTSGSSDPACPRNLPAGYSVEFRARFVKPVASGAQETYSLVPVPATYSWDPDPYSNQDFPPAQLLELTVKSSWTFGGKARSFEVASLIGDREFGEVTVRGIAKIDYLINVQTRYTDATGAKSQLIANGGISESRIETKTASTADQAVQSAEIELLEVPSDPSVTPAELGSISGASSFHHAAPDAIPSGATQSAQSITTTTAGIDGTRTSNLKVAVANELPTATGTFTFDAPGGTERLLWVNGQVAVDNATSLRLDNSQDLVSFRPRPGQTATGTTSALTTSPASVSRKIETTAEASFGRLRILPTLATSLIGGPIGDGSTTERAVVVIDDFTSSVACKATGTTSGGNASSGSKSWSAKLHYWTDSNPADNIPFGSYQTINLSSANVSDPLQPFGPTGQNPLVYDGANPADDIYLFRQTGPGGNKGYLQSWSNALGQTAAIDATGKTVKASIQEAIRVVTAPTNPSEADSSLSISIGKLSCDSLDAR
jgi:prepilin-type N-terminal cleavage/methylation domain-containing protein